MPITAGGYRQNVLPGFGFRKNLGWVAGAESFAERREAQLDTLGDLIAENVERDALLRLIEGSVPEGLPFVPPGGTGLSAERLELGELTS